MGVSRGTLLEKHFQMRLPVQVVLCVLFSILIQQERMKGNANPTTTPLKEEPEFNDPTDESLQLTIADKTDGVSENKQDFEEIKNEFQNKLEKLINHLVSLTDKLQGEIEGIQGDITNVKGNITNVQGDIVDMQNANSALCAYQDEVGGG